MIKAILITESNQSSLGSSYASVEDVEEQLPVGYYLVTEFGNEETFDVLTAEEFSSTFNVVGKINNDYLDVAFK